MFKEQMKRNSTAMSQTNAKKVQPLLTKGSETPGTGSGIRAYSKK
jgi:hypothetical protein